MTWNRRSVLRALATSTAAPLVVPILQACSSGVPAGRRITRLAQLSQESIRLTLREVVSGLSQKFSHATGLATMRQLSRAMVDADERAIHREMHTAVVLEIEHQGRRFEQAATLLSSDGIRALAQQLRTRAAADYQSSRPATPLASPRSFKSSMDIDPATLPERDWLPRLEKTYEASRHVGGSRIVYRGAYLSVEDRTDVFVGRGRDLTQRLVRTRAGVVLLARRSLGHSPVPVVEVAERSGLMGLEATALSRAALESAAERVLAMVSPTSYPTGVMPLIFDPAVAALFARGCVGAALDGRRWVVGESRAAALHRETIASERVTLIDDPSAEGAYGSYFFDDEGQLAEPARLIERGVLIRPITDRASAMLLDVPRTANGRRRSPLSAVHPRISNLSLAPGPSTRAQLLAGVERGLLLDGGLLAQVDPVSWRFSLRAARAYEIRAGKTTGVLHGDLDVRGHVPDVLRAIEGVSAQAVRAPADSAVPATASSPSLLTRAEVV